MGLYDSIAFDVAFDDVGVAARATKPTPARPEHEREDEPHDAHHHQDPTDRDEVDSFQRCIDGESKNCPGGDKQKASGAGGDNVVDADFEEVKDDKKKSA